MNAINKQKNISPIDIILSQDSGFAFMVLSTFGIMFIPLPAFLLDALLSLSLSLSIVIFLFSLQIEKPLEFSSFPSVLLLSTLFRLSLNIASTRRILLHGSEGPGSAGYVVEAFGHFIVGSNLIVGIIIFIILIIINFVVITKGASRIAEVSARFTLDSLPGKQMAIDADLAAGLCTEVEAKERRRQLQKEADFFGSMDGASKFVRGDAVAGVLVMLVNIIGGFLIGIISKKLSWEKALETYTQLTIGDGLVAQVPALITSITAGLVTTRASSEERISGSLGRQLFGQTQTFLLSSVFLLFLSVFPGMPHLAFFLTGLSLGGIAFYLNSKEQALQTLQSEKSSNISPKNPREEIENAIPLQLVEVSVGYDLLPLIEDPPKGALFRRIANMRQQIARDLGLIIPPIQIQDNIRLKSGQYSIALSGCQIAQGSIRIGKFLAIHPEDALADIPGEHVKEPSYGLPSRWISSHDIQRAELMGATVADAPMVLTTHLSEILQQYSHELLDRTNLQALLELHGKTIGKVIEELIPGTLSTTILIKVLRSLLKERVSIRDFRTILETLADYIGESKDPDQLVEWVRIRLGKQIVKPYLQDNNVLPALVLDVELEQTLRQLSQKEGRMIDPNEVKNVSERFEEASKKLKKNVQQWVILVVNDIRRTVLTFANRYFPRYPVLSFREVDATIQVKTLGVIGTKTDMNHAKT